MITENNAERALEDMMKMFQRHDEKLEHIETAMLTLTQIFRDAAAKLNS